MMRTPKGVSPAAAGRPAVGLPCSQHKMKVFSSGAAVKAEFFSTGLSSPPMSTVPVGYFTQICNTALAEQRAHSLYSTPHGPEAKPIRSSSGRLPLLRLHLSPRQFSTCGTCLYHCRREVKASGLPPKSREAASVSDWSSYIKLFLNALWDSSIPM
ncbi:unnamed protein product [Pleuronectes platessa]|uniref:Uncharacterized protein n=1 Tax=Pleuronectes platessa TaxID=8262 RepID=A0A9N7TVJ7_PLEPL|nr:unnamed protein product [Pleuronectes platessa]